MSTATEGDHNMNAHNTIEEDPRSPFHPGERAVQTLAGVRDEAETRGRRMLSPELNPQQRAFFRQFLGLIRHFQIPPVHNRRDKERQAQLSVNVPNRPLIAMKFAACAGSGNLVPVFQPYRLGSSRL